jgi:hypothetical protein
MHRFQGVGCGEQNIMRLRNLSELLYTYKLHQYKVVLINNLPFNTSFLPGFTQVVYEGQKTDPLYEESLPCTLRCFNIE